ncbi:MAG: ABC transporter permease [Burkholderiaceae bacterium]|jgi:lipopolysaccharide transport system permease protein|nr:ABC transporter permease [Burkholderiaceae bacterium]
MPQQQHATALMQQPAARARAGWRQSVVLWRYWLAREWKTRYAGSALGALWAVIQPVAMLGIFYVLFGHILAIRIPGLETSGGYLLYLLAGLVVWLPFVDAVGRGVGCLVAHEDFLRKQPIPAEILPSVAVGSTLPTFVVGYALFLLICRVKGVGVYPSWAYLPLLLVAQVVLTMGMTFLLSMANFLWRDVGAGVVFVLQLWFYLTPIVYPMAQVPERFHAWFLLNPVACLILALQASVLHLPMPNGTLWALLAWVLLIGGGGWWFFRSMKSALGEAL